MKKVVDVPSDQWVVVVSEDLVGYGRASAGIARGIVRRELSASVSRSCLDDMVLATSELVTNATMYSPEPYRLTIAEQPMTSRLRVAIGDNNPAPLPALGPQHPSAIGGRGLHIVDRIADSWGHTLTGAGKEVWFEVQP